MYMTPYQGEELNIAYFTKLIKQGYNYDVVQCDTTQSYPARLAKFSKVLLERPLKI